MTISLERATPEYYDDFVRIYAEVSACHVDAVPWMFRTPEGEIFSREHYESLIADEQTYFVLAIDDGRAVGAVNAIIRESVDIPILRPRHYLKVNDIAVLTEYRSQGIGSRLLSEVEVWGRARGIHEIELQVWDFNESAKAFYAKRGFDTVSRVMRRTF